MNNKKTIILAIVLVVLVALAYAYQGPVKKWQENFSKPTNFLGKVNVAKIDKIIIAKNGETTLARQGDDWLVAGTKFKVGKTVMTEALDKLDQASKAGLELVSTNKQKKSDFKTDSTGVTLKLYEGGKEIVKFVVGKVGADYESSYIAQPEVDNTYLLKQVNLTYALDKDEWRDRTIFSGEATKINKLRIQQGSAQFSAAKSGDKWTTADSKKIPLDKEKVEKIISLMTGLTAAGIPTQDFRAAGLEKNQLIVEAAGESIKNVLMVGNDNGKGEFYAKRGDSDNIYLISKSDRDELNRKIEQLK